jgi:hypothetical protein
LLGQNARPKSSWAKKLGQNARPRHRVPIAPSPTTVLNCLVVVEIMGRGSQPVVVIVGNGLFVGRGRRVVGRAAAA